MASLACSKYLIPLDRKSTQHYEINGFVMAKASF
jgi:hypothetical protein